MGKDFYASAQLPWHRAMIAALVMKLYTVVMAFSCMFLVQYEMLLLSQN